MYALSFIFCHTKFLVAPEAELGIIQKSQLLCADPTVLIECPFWQDMLLSKLTGNLREGLKKGELYT